jgi:hypothetical protein
MKPVSRSLLNRLLSGKEGLSAVDKEEILGNVLAQAQVPRRAWWKLPAFGLGLSAVAASLIAVVYFSVARPDEFVARGVEAPDLEVACMLGEVRSSCREGSRLLFKVSPGGARYVSALARAPDHRLLWYFEGVDLASLPASGVLPEASVLGPEHGTGAFEVIAIFSAERLSKDALRALVDGPASPKGAVVLRRPLAIEP